MNLDRFEKLIRLEPNNKNLIRDYISFCLRTGTKPIPSVSVKFNKLLLKDFHQIGDFYFSDSEYVIQKFLNTPIKIQSLTDLIDLRISSDCEKYFNKISYLNAPNLKILRLDNVGYLDNYNALLKMKTPQLERICFREHHFVLDFIFELNFIKLKNIYFKHMFELDMNYVEHIRAARQKNPFYIHNFDSFIPYFRMETIVDRLRRIRSKYPELLINGLSFRELIRE